MTLSVFAEVYVFESAAQDCNTYTLVATETDIPEPGMNYCTSVANSTGNAAFLTATGSNSVAANDLVLTANDVPNTFTFFFFGPNQIQTPFNNGGFRCVGGQTQRLNPPTQAMNNTVSKTVLPGPFVFSSGQQVNFQCWFRDPNVGPDGANTTDGYEVNFIN